MVPTADRIHRPRNEEAERIQKQVGYAERRLAALGRDGGEPRFLRASKVLNALNHCLSYGAAYGPQLDSAVREFLKEIR